MKLKIRIDDDVRGAAAREVLAEISRTAADIDHHVARHVMECRQLLDAVRGQHRVEAIRVVLLMTKGREQRQAAAQIRAPRGRQRF